MWILLISVQDMWILCGLKQKSYNPTVISVFVRDFRDLPSVGEFAG